MSPTKLIVCLLLSCAGGAAAAADEPVKDAERPHGLTARVPWTSSNFRGRPEPPPPYQAERLYSQLRFERTTLIATPPGSDQIFVGERGGKIFVLPKDRDAKEAAVFLDCKTLVEQLNRDAPMPYAFESLYGLTFDPDYVANRYCYVCYVVKQRQSDREQPSEGTRVSRFRVGGDPPRCEVESERLVISWRGGGHNGGCLKFGPDRLLYVSTGDGGEAFPPDGLKSGQDLTTLLAKILRIDVRREENGRPYAVPKDNPFVSVAGARGETWAYGLRNPWKMSFDRGTGQLWAGDVGWELWELVYHVRRGDNFGWSIVEGSQTVHAERPRGPTPIVPAAMEIPHTEGASITGGFVYRGRKFPELRGVYVFGDWETRRIWGAKVVDGKLGERYELLDPTIRIVDFAESPDGELYLLDHDDGSIFTLARNVPTAATSPFPRKLSETGLFASVARHEPAPGVLPFSINAEQWSDGAAAERYIAVPGSESIRVRPKPTGVPGSQFSRATDYPRDTVLLKTLSLETVAGDPASRRRIETQTLHYDGREWQGYTFAWNAEQTDAELVDRRGGDRAVTITDPASPGGKRTQSWRYAARADCIRCHNPWSEYALAFNVAQLNREHDYGNVRDDQLRALRHIGLIVDDSDAEASPKRRGAASESKSQPRLTPPFDETADIDARARSYLHVNCSHCHRFNGGGSSYIFLQHHLSLADTKAIGVRPTQGTFGIYDARLLAPGDPYRSVLYFRMAKTGPGHMPHLGAKLVDEQALALVHDWILQLPGGDKDAAQVERFVDWNAANDSPEEFRRRTSEMLATPSRALLLADAVRNGRIPESGRRQVLQAALAGTTDPAIRDLFEAFVPEEERTQRLGEAIDPAKLLSLAGDEQRGRKLFHESTVVQCRNCHRIGGGQSADLGPDLDAVGKKYDRAKLLTSILQPSLQIDPKYAAWLVETKSGLVHAGLKVRQNDEEIVIRDAQNKLHRVATADIEGVYPQAKSLMPEMLLRDFTPQQAADLLAYLSTLKTEPPAPR